MNKKIFMIILILCITIGIFLIFNNLYKSNINDKDNDFNENMNNSNNKSENNNEEDNMVNSNDNNINITINGKNYNAILEYNETAQTFKNLLPKDFNMNELNGNEKYVYIDNSLPTNSSNPKYIKAGDIMLYGDNCLVIFYKSFNTSYSYTRIGHIDNLPNLGNGNVTVKFEK